MSRFTRTSAFVAGVFLCLGAVTVLAIGTEEPAPGAPGPANSFRLFEGKNYTRESVEIKLSDYEKGKVHSLKETRAWRSASSVKWNLAGGVIVVIYSEEDGSGRQHSIWRSGANPDLSKNSFNNAAEGWAWYKR